MTNCTITVVGNVATISGDFPLPVVQKATSYPVEGYRFSQAYRNHGWDGRKKLFNSRYSAFPAGLVEAVVQAIKKKEKEAVVQVFDKRDQSPPISSTAGFDLIGIEFGKDKYDYQLLAAQEMVNKKRGIIKLAVNSGKTEVYCAVTKYLQVPTLLLVRSLELLYQARARFSLRLGIPLEQIGIIGDNEFSVGDWITVSTPASLHARMATPEVCAALSKWQLVFADEAHAVSSDVFYDVMNSLRCHWRFGGSATPLDRSDGADLRLIAQTGSVIYEVPNKVLVDRGISVQPYVHMIRIDNPKILDYGLTWKEVNRLGVVDNTILNNKIAEKASSHVKEGKQVLICIEYIAHGKTLHKLLSNYPHMRHVFIHGAEDSDTRRAVLDDFKSGKLNCIIATSILDEGVDVPNIDVLIYGSGGKAKIRTLQRAGRGLRSDVGKDKLIIIDFAYTTHKYLAKHSLERLKTYKSEKCFIISVID